MNTLREKKIKEKSGLNAILKAYFIKYKAYFIFFFQKSKKLRLNIWIQENK